MGIKVNKEKTEELLIGLKGENVTLIDIDKYFQKQGVLVDVHVRGTGNTFKLNPKALGVNVKKTEETADFYNKYIEAGQIGFIEKDLQKSIRTINSTLRNKMKDLSIGYNNKYLTIDKYKEFKKVLEQQRARYDEIISQIGENWERIIPDFSRNLDGFLTAMEVEDREEVRAKMISKIPSKDKFISKCKIDIDILAFPSVDNVSVLDTDLTDEMKEFIEEKSLATVYEILTKILNDSFETINKVLIAYNKSNSITTAKMKDLYELEKRIKSKNLLKHPLVERICSSLININKMSDEDDIISTLEGIQTLTYMFVKDIELEDCLDLTNSILGEKELTALSFGYKLALD